MMPEMVHARFYDWNDSERIKLLARKNYKTAKIFVDQRYGPDTTWRRNQAMAARKELKAQGAIVKGFVKYPAKLLVKYTLADEHYSTHKDFSPMDVLIRELEDVEL